jgi:hypothetical protein
MKATRLLEPAMWSYAVQRLCTWYPLRRMLSSVVAATRPAHPLQRPEEASTQLLGELRSDGIAMLPGFVSAEIIERIKTHLQSATLNERFAPFRKGFTLDSVPENVHVAEYDTEYVLRCPEVVALANHPRLLEAAARYLCCKPTISSISVWWSLPADGTAQEAENWHRDVDEWRFVKFFLYMTDVDEAGGPHCFVRGSHRSPRFRRIRRIDDREVSRVFPAQDQLRITGRSGDAFLEDTFGLHKGQPPTGRLRLLLQVEYSINPIAVYSYRSSVQPPAGLTVDRYINRLYLRPAD